MKTEDKQAAARRTAVGESMPQGQNMVSSADREMTVHEIISDRLQKLDKLGAECAAEFSELESLRDCLPRTLPHHADRAMRRMLCGLPMTYHFCRP